MAEVKHRTKLGKYYVGDSGDTLKGRFGKNWAGKVQLILTSPPFPLNEKKSYGNFKGEFYKNWFIELAETFSSLLADDGSIVIELGNSWEPGRPVQSLLHLESLIGFTNNPQANLRLIQQFVCYNPARLPSPAQWVTIERIRLTDSFTHIWWLAKNDFPKADNTKVLRPYSKAMQNLLKRQSYNAGNRPSEHRISENGFAKNHGGSIMPNVLELEPMEGGGEVRLPNAMRVANTSSNDFFHRACREMGIKLHPARMPEQLASFFIEFLTEPGDLVLDPFAGSNTTGYTAEKLGRRWLSIEVLEKYAEQSKIRFKDPLLRELRRERRNNG